MNTELLSFYIPRMNINYTKSSVKNLLEDNISFVIKRIDFVSIVNPDKSVNSNYRSAFIHVYLGSYCCEEVYKITHIEAKAYKLYLVNGYDSYWLLLKNNNPIPETELNLCQVVENARLLEERVEKQEAIIKYQSEKLLKLEDSLYQLLGGLYNQSTQENTLHHHLTCLLDNPVLWSPKNNVEQSPWTIWPTTRQGDASEKRIEELEKDLTILKQFVLQKVTDDISTHSSMPDLISSTDLVSMPDEDNDSIYSYSTHSSMPSLGSINDNSDSSREERIINSAVLCGNN
jgi:hypothetical protein